MSNAIIPTENNVIESVVIGGDLSKLSADQRVSYYMAVCKSLNLNPLTKPFDYINLNGKLTLYARKDCAEQLRRINKISIDKPDITFQDDWIIVTVTGHDAEGRTDSDIGVVSRKDMRGDFGNAVMKAVTKAKRRLTLSISGLGMLDETEVETIPDARPVVVKETGEIIDAPALPVKNGKDDQPADEKAWAAWTALADKADVLGISYPLAAKGISTGALRQMYAELKERVKAAEAEIPA